jgi:hypothetical protein
MGWIIHNALGLLNLVVSILILGRLMSTPADPLAAITSAVADLVAAVTAEVADLNAVIAALQALASQPTVNPTEVAALASQIETNVTNLNAAAAAATAAAPPPASGTPTPAVRRA